MNARTIVLLTFLMMTNGCGIRYSNIPDSEEPRTNAIELLEKREYHKAMRELPNAMSEWERYTEHTGNTAEGAAGYLYSHIMFTTAATGDADWGKILDDPDIPYSYKTDLLFEISEARLGKGSAWTPSPVPVIILPTTNTVDSWSDVYILLRKVLSEQTSAGDSDTSVAPEK